MVLFMQPSVSSTQKWSIRPFILARTTLVTSVIISMLSVSACQTLQVPAPAPKAATTTTVIQMPAINEDDYVDDSYADGGYEEDYPIEPYVPPEHVTTPDPVAEQAQAPVVHPNPIITAPSRNNSNTPPAPPSRNELLERARQNSQLQSRPATSNNSNIPAFQNLMQSGINQLKAGNLTTAESSFTRAQRLAPKSTAVYFYLSQVALKKNQPRKAEAMARRGLSISTDNSRRNALWQLVLRSGQMQNNPRVIKEAQQALR